MGNRKVRVLVAAVALAASTSCGFMTDAATRLAYDIERGAADLRRSGQGEARVVHHPKARPEGCSAAYQVTLQESLHHPSSGGSLLVGCVGTPNYESLGYSYSTTYHLNAVRVPTQLRVMKVAAAPVTVVLRKSGGAVDVVALQ